MGTKMAAPILKFVTYVPKSLVLNISKCSPIVMKDWSRKNHTLFREVSDEKIVMADNGSTIVCWHPEQSFPYEHSLPLPKQSCDVNQVLKDSITEDVNELLNSKPQFQREYLTKVTATTKHRWFPQPAKKFRKKTKPDREFL